MGEIKIIFIGIFLLLTCGANAQMVLQYEVEEHTEISLSLNGAVNVQVDWGDGSSAETFISSGNKTHTYISSGIKNVTISGTLEHFGTSDFSGDNARLTKVLSWDGLGLTSLSFAFYNAALLTQVPLSLPSTVTDVSGMF